MFSDNRQTFFIEKWTQCYKKLTWAIQITTTGRELRTLALHRDIFPCHYKLLIAEVHKLHQHAIVTKMASNGSSAPQSFLIHGPTKQLGVFRGPTPYQSLSAQYELSLLLARLNTFIYHTKINDFT